MPSRSASPPGYPRPLLARDYLRDYLMRRTRSPRHPLANAPRLTLLPPALTLPIDTSHTTLPRLMVIVAMARHPDRARSGDYTRHRALCIVVWHHNLVT